MDQSMMPGMGPATALFFLAAMVAATVVPVLLAKPEMRMMRAAYIARSALYLVVMLALNWAAAMTNVASGGIVATAISIAIGVVFMFWTVYRLRDIGWSKWCALIFLVPMVNFVFWILLLCVKGKMRASHA